MDLSKISIVFKFIILGIFYVIIFIALKIMYKDIKNVGKQKTRRRTMGLEILSPGNNSTLKKGGLIPLSEEIKIGRKIDNTVVLEDEYVSAHHAVIYLIEGEYILEDLRSTNGTYLNDEKIVKKSSIIPGDIIKIGSIVLKVI